MSPELLAIASKSSPACAEEAKLAAAPPAILVWKALAGLFFYDLLNLGHDFYRMHLWVKKWQVSPRQSTLNAVDQVCKAVNRACIWYPKRVLCLQRSAVTTCLLRDCGIAAQMVMGAQTTPFKAHAWTEVNGTPVNERRPVDSGYQVLERC